MPILVPIDDSDLAREALAFAFEEHPEAAFVVLHVINPYRAVLTRGFRDPETTLDDVQTDAEALLEEAEALADEHGVSVETEIAFGTPKNVIIEYAELDEIEAIILGSHGRTGVSRAFLGSVAETIVRRSPVPVTVVR